MQDPTTSGAPGGAPAFSPFPDQPRGAGNGSALGQQAQAAAGEAAQAATSIGEQAKQKLSGALDGQKGTAADMVQKLADTVKQSGEQFQGKQDWIASAVGRGAEELNTLAGSLRDKNVGDLLGEAQSFARRQPAMFMAAALAAGFAVARLGKVVAGDLSRDDLPTVPSLGKDAEGGNGQH
jgi:hypothetical protein